MDLRRIARLTVMVLGMAAVFGIVQLAAAGLVGPADDPTLADAAEQRNGSLVRTLLEEGAEVNLPQVDGMTALHWAVYHEDVETATLLVRSGADVAAENRYGVPPLSVAATNGNADLVTVLLEAGADPNITLRGGETVLMTAARTGSLGAVRAL